MTNFARQKHKNSPQQMYPKNWKLPILQQQQEIMSNRRRNKGNRYQFKSSCMSLKKEWKRTSSINSKKRITFIHQKYKLYMLWTSSIFVTQCLSFPKANIPNCTASLTDSLQLYNNSIFNYFYFWVANIEREYSALTQETQVQSPGNKILFTTSF